VLPYELMHTIEDSAQIGNPLDSFFATHIMGCDAFIMTSEVAKGKLVFISSERSRIKGLIF